MKKVPLNTKQKKQNKTNNSTKQKTLRCWLFKVIAQRIRLPLTNSKLYFSLYFALIYTTLSFSCKACHDIPEHLLLSERPLLLSKG